MNIRAHGVTDVGLVRAQNEDSLVLLPESELYVVADGMGGHNSGEVASQLTISAMKSFYEDPGLEERLREEHQEFRGQEGIPNAFSEYKLLRAVESANMTIFNTAQRFEAYREMGTTVVAVQIVKTRIYVAFVGDSRLYRFRDGKLEQLTEDHSLANEYVRMGVIRKEDVRTFPYRNVIVKALGLGSVVETETFYRGCKPGDLFLLCSDGLTDMVENEGIEEILSAADGDLEGANARLVDAAKAKGGVDNITSLLVAIGEGEGE